MPPDSVPQPQAIQAGWRERLSLLRVSDFRKIWLAGGLYGTVRWLDMLAVGVFTYEVTNSPLIVAFMVFLRLLPLILMGTVIGALAERFNRRRMLLGGLIVLSVVCAVLGLLALSGRITLWHVGVGALVNGTLFSADFSVRRMLLGEVAGLSRLGAAMGLDSATNNATRMAGPLIGGLVYQAIGLEGTYLVGFLLTGLAALLIARLTGDTSTPAVRGSSLLQDIVEGLRYIRTNRVVTSVLVITVLMNLFAFPYLGMIPVIGKDVLNLSPSLIGVLAAADGCGACFGALIVAVFAPSTAFRRIFFVGSTVVLLAVLVFSLSPIFGLSVSVLLIGGLGLAGFGTMQTTLIFVEVPSAVRGRVLGVLTVCIGTMPIGMLAVGYLANWVGTARAISLMSVCGLVAITVVMVLWRERR
ncbi:MAG: MFS transporter [Pseudomonadota bacterium]|nr:MFS transporter [Pseudomonadota bacterium]